MGGLFLLLTFSIKAQVACLQFGGTRIDEAHHMIESSDGGFVMVGHTNSFGNNSNGPNGVFDVYIVKIDPSGNLAWTRTIGGTGNDEGRSIIQTPDGGYAIAGWTNSYGAGNYDVYIARLSSTGTVLWTKTIGGTGNEMGWEIINTTDGGFAIAGQIASLNSTLSDYYVIKLDGTGNKQWDKKIGVATTDEVANSIVLSPDGGYAICGSLNKSITNTTDNDYYLVKLDGSGNLSWTKQYAGTYNQYARQIKNTSDGGFIMVGEGALPKTNGSETPFVFVMKTQSDGTPQWSNYFGETNNIGTSNDNNDHGESIFQVADGGYIIGGWSAGFNNSFNLGKSLGVQYYFLKINGTGNLLWSRVSGDTYNEKCYIAIPASDGTFALTGFTETKSNNDNNIYFIRYDVGLRGCCESRFKGAQTSYQVVVSSPGTLANGLGLVSSGNISGSGGSLVLTVCRIDMLLVATPTPIPCKGACSGTAVAEASGGTAPYTYTWYNSAGDSIGTGSSLNGLCVGTYTVKAVDSQGYTKITSVSVTQPDSYINPSVTISSTTNNCLGDLVTFTAYPSGGGSSPTFQWYLNGQPVGTNSSTFSSTSLQNGDVVTLIMNSSDPCATSPVANSNPVQVALFPKPTTDLISHN